MRFVYIDEAGTSAQEPIRVVAAVIIQPDAEWRAIHEAMERCFDKHVPAARRAGFVFHAHKVYQAGRENPDWPFQDRLCFLEDFMRIRRRFMLPVSFGMCRNNMPDYERLQALNPSKMTQEAFEHIMAFMGCLIAVDDYLRAFTPKDDIATAVAEDVTHMRSLLAKAKATINLQQTVVDVDWMEETSSERFLRDGLEMKIDKIVGPVHFTKKDEDPMLQLADACAFTFKRALAKQPDGDTLSRMLIGRAMDADKFHTDFSLGTLSTLRANVSKLRYSGLFSPATTLPFLLRAISGYQFRL